MKTELKIIYVDEKDVSKILEYSKLVQSGKYRYYGYATGKFMYSEI